MRGHAGTALYTKGGVKWFGPFSLLYCGLCWAGSYLIMVIFRDGVGAKGASPGLVLRPKHTAILITSLTGGFIALFSIVSLMIIVPTVRDVVTHGENAIQENKRLIADENKQQLTNKLERERQDRENRRTVQAYDKEITDLQRKSADVQKQLVNAQSSLPRLQARLDTLKATISANQARLAKLVASNKQLETQNVSAGIINEQISRQNVDLGHQNGELDKANRSLISSSKTLEQKNIRLSKIGEQQTDSNDRLWRYNVNLVSANEKLESDKSVLERQIADYNHQREEVIDLIHQRDQFNEQLKDLSSRIAQKYSVLRQGYVILRAGVELGRISMVDAHLRPEAIKRQVASLLGSASEQAKKFGAADNEDGQAASLLPQQKPTLTGYESVDEHTQLDSLARDWSGQDVSYVVVATTVTNCLAGEPAYIELHRYPVVRVYTKGAEVASRKIDGHSKVDDIIDDLMMNLQKGRSEISTGSRHNSKGRSRNGAE